MSEQIEFDPVRLAEPRIKVLHIEGVGDVKYSMLTLEDYLALKELPNETEKDTYIMGLEMAHRMLVKAYPELTIDHMLHWPHEKLMKITEALLDIPDFRARPSENGSGSQTRPKHSGRSAGSSRNSPPK